MSPASEPSDMLSVTEVPSRGGEIAQLDLPPPPPEQPAELPPPPAPSYPS
ncbi:MAG: hypothetical protein IPK07_02490 [Deltaproteobacteria bacterium]|nr:hypothetical protein [Deltaproteobacteria bacterium]